MFKQKKSIATILSVGILSLSQNAFAADSAQQTVTYEVAAINELSVSGATASLTVNAAVAGSAPTTVSDTSTTYAITTNEENRKITGAINSNMPAGVTLAVNLAAPAGASTVPNVALTSVAKDLVTGISTLNESDKQITYSLAATSLAGVVASASKTVTLTITAGS
jgi:hypothetical protein